MIIGNKSDLEVERTVEQNLASSKINELGLTYMEVSAKTGHNIKEFFKEMACVIAGGKKSKEESTPSKAAPAQKTETKPAASSGTVPLSANPGKEGRKNKKC